MRVSLLIEGKVFLGASFSVDEPKNDEEVVELLKLLILAIKAPKTPYTDDLPEAQEPHPEAKRLASEVFEGAL